MKTGNQVRYLFLIFVSLSFVACGGSGDSISGDVLRVTSTTPVAGATEVDVDTVVRAVFSKDVLGSSVTDSTIVVEDAQGTVGGSVAFDSASNEATFIPNQSLGLLRDYSVIIKNSVMDLSGDSMVADYSWVFTTRDGSWQNALEIVKAKIGNISFTSQAMDESGNALVISMQVGPLGIPGLYARYYSIDTGWSSLELISSAVDIFLPKIAMDRNGNAVAVWYQAGEDNRANIWANYFTPANGWGSAELIENFSGTATNPQLKMDAQGNALVVWDQADDSNNIPGLGFNSFSPVTGWGKAGLINIEGMWVDGGTDFQFAVDASGNALIVWKDEFVFSAGLWANYYTRGSGWSAPMPVYSDTEGMARPFKLAMNVNGQAMLVWNEFNGRTRVKASYFIREEGWSQPIQVDKDDLEYTYNPIVAIDAGGNAIAVWVQDGSRDPNGRAQNLWVNRYDYQTGWGVAELLETDADYSADSAQVMLDAGGNGVGAWRQQNSNGEWNIWARRFVKSVGWGESKIMNAPKGKSVLGPIMEMNQLGRGVIAWQEIDTSGTERTIGLWYTQFE